MSYPNELKVVGAIATTAAMAELGSITVATVTSSASGILGVLGFTSTTAVALPVGGAIAIAGLVGYGLYKGIRAAQGS
jgi:hypothetical protein